MSKCDAAKALEGRPANSDLITGWARELPNLRSEVLLGCALRSTRVDGLLDKDTLAGIEAHLLYMPPLADAEIDDLIQVLDTNNRLGVLKGRSPTERIDAFKKQAGRQLLVAMIQATSGRDFKQKVIDEFLGLNERQRFIYAAVCLVHAQRYAIDRDEILHALGGGDNAALNDLEALIRQHMLIRETVQTDYRARHRVIADEVVDAMQERALTGQILEGLCFAFAQKVNQTTPFNARSRKRLNRFINHDFVLKMTHDADVGRAIYVAIESLLSWDYHFWLQRGALEVEAGGLDLAKHFLDQSISIMPEDRFVQTEYAYMLMKRAAQGPEHPDARAWFDEGAEMLDHLIESDGRASSYPFHVLGSQGLAWVHRAGQTRDEKRALLSRLVQTVDRGLSYHPRQQDLIKLARDLKTELLMTAVSSGA